MALPTEDGVGMGKSGFCTSSELLATLPFSYLHTPLARFLDGFGTKGVHLLSCLSPNAK